MEGKRRETEWKTSKRQTDRVYVLPGVSVIEKPKTSIPLPHLRGTPICISNPQLLVTPTYNQSRKLAIPRVDRQPKAPINIFRAFLAHTWKRPAPMSNLWQKIRRPPISNELLLVGGEGPILKDREEIQLVGVLCGENIAAGKLRLLGLREFSWWRDERSVSRGDLARP